MQQTTYVCVTHVFSVRSCSIRLANLYAHGKITVKKISYSYRFVGHDADYEKIGEVLKLHLGEWCTLRAQRVEVWLSADASMGLTSILHA